METFENQPISWLGALGKYMCFFSFAILFFTVPSLTLLLWKLASDSGDEPLREAVLYLVGIVGAALCAFIAGLLFVFRRPFVAIGLLVAGFVIVAWTFPDR